MKFLKKDVNMSLLFFITFFLVLFIGFTLYYEYKLRDIVLEKNMNEEMLGVITARLTLSQMNNSATVNKLALLDKAVLEQKYDELAVQNENLKRMLDTMQDQIILLNSQLEYQKARLEGPTEQFRLIQSKNEQIKKLDEQIKNLCIILKAKNITFESC